MLLRKLATIVGMATVAFGMFSCDNGGTSGGSSGRICCTFTNYYDQTITACEGDTYAGYLLTGYYWNSFKEDYVYYYGGTCS